MSEKEVNLLLDELRAALLKPTICENEVSRILNERLDGELNFKVIREPIRELTPELISNIREKYNNYKTQIKEALNYNKDRFVRNRYFQMVFVILCHHRFGVPAKKGLSLIKAESFARLFELRANTLRDNISYLNFYAPSKIGMFSQLEHIFYDIEKSII